MHLHLHILPNLYRKPIPGQLLHLKHKGKNASMVQKSAADIILDGGDDVPKDLELGWWVSHYSVQIVEH